MNKLWGGLGSLIWWMLWPLWFIYFKLKPKRARVLVVCGGEVLLVRGWLSTKKYVLPGGGLNNNETSLGAACRELVEETGIEAMESALVKIGAWKHKQYKLKLNTVFFSLELNEKPILKLRRLEILSAMWVPIELLDKSLLNEEVNFALKRYRPIEQSSLL